MLVGSIKGKYCVQCPIRENCRPAYRMSSNMVYWFSHLHKCYLVHMGEGEKIVNISYMERSGYTSEHSDSIPKSVNSDGATYIIMINQLATQLGMGPNVGKITLHKERIYHCY